MITLSPESAALFKGLLNKEQAYQTLFLMDRINPYLQFGSLLENGVLKEIQVQGRLKKPSLYSSSEDHDPYSIARALWPRAYFCNFTAVFYHGLTNQIPHSVYLAIEAKGREKDKATQRQEIRLSDPDLFEAFVKPARLTKHVYSYRETTIILTERVDRQEAGVIEVSAGAELLLPPGSRVTCLERALIDACVHPQYNGGITSVVSYFRKAVDRIDIVKLAETYEALAFTYPYWQSIGFILERVGAQEASNYLYQRHQIRNAFYIDHEAKASWKYDERWSLYYPRELF